MKIITSTIVLLLILLFGCKNQKQPKCYYRLKDLLDSNKVNLVMTSMADSLIEIQDKPKDSGYSYGVYSFDKFKKLKFYGFFIDSLHYKYSELYDSNGIIYESHGVPLVEYRILKTDQDTILFNVYLFSLNKKYEEIEIVSNFGDTVRPKYLYKADIYSNMKCFPFKLPVVRSINKLILYAKVIVSNTCSHDTTSFLDTTLFSNIKL